VQPQLSDPAIILVIKHLAKLGAKEDDIISFFHDCNVSKEKTLSLIDTLVENGELAKEEGTFFGPPKFHVTEQLPEVPAFIIEIIAAHVTKKYRLEF